MTSPVLPPLFDRLVDDAAVFPPGDMPLTDAVPAHHGHRRAWYASFVGPLLCPASRLPELRDLPGDGDEPLGVAIVVDTGTAGVLEAVDDVAHDSRIVLRGVEIPVRGEPLSDSARRLITALDVAMGGSDDDEPAYVEVAHEPGWESAVDVIAEAGYRAKLRTGAPQPGAAPSDREVAEFVVACLDRAVAFKFTAGLHHAVRRLSDGHHEHGFLNTLLAVADALDGGDVESVAATLAVDDADAIVSRVRALPDDRAATLRRWYTSFGSCSVAEPLDELIGLGLVTPPASAH